MKMIFHFGKYQKTILCLFLAITSLKSQDYQQLKLKDAIEIGLNNNKNIKISHLKQHISKTKEKDLKMEKLPDVNFHTSISRVADLMQYESGYNNKPTKYEIYDAMYDFTLDASIPIYKGGKIRNTEKKAEIDTEITKLKTKLDERQLKMQIITAYLQIHHLKEQEDLLKDKMREDSANIHETKLLKKNGLVTNNEVLRTELQLSNHKMTMTELENDVLIAEHKLKTLLSLPEEQELHVDTENLLSEDSKIPYLEELISTAFTQDENLKIAKKNIHLKQLDKKIVRANWLPTISVSGEYFLKYPNYMFFPPTNHAYRFGMVGLHLNYPIENLYKNKYRMQDAKEMIELAKLEVEEREENLRHDVFTSHKKFEETEQKVIIAEKAIEQAKENYRIVTMKYANKLSLITELIDADNAYLEARSNLISVKINRQLKYYQLQYTIGNL